MCVGNVCVDMWMEVCGVCSVHSVSVDVCGGVYEVCMVCVNCGCSVSVYVGVDVCVEVCMGRVDCGCSVSVDVGVDVCVEVCMEVSVVWCVCGCVWR